MKKEDILEKIKGYKFLDINNALNFLENDI